MKNIFQIRIIILACFTIIFFPSSYAGWKPFITINTGAVTSSDLTPSQHFSIENPVTDEFYRYSASSATETSSLFGGFVGAEGMLRSNWLMDAGIEYNQASPFSARGTFVQGNDASSQNSYRYHYSILARQLLLETKILHPYKNCFYPYFLIGLGASFNKASHYYTNVPPFLTFTRRYADHTSTSLSYALGLGIDADISSYFRLGVGYRFANLGMARLGQARIDTSRVTGTLSQTHLFANEFVAQLTMIFR